MSNVNTSKSGMSSQHQRRQSMPVPAPLPPISTNVHPTIIATPPSATAGSGIFSSRFSNRHPMMLHSGQSPKRLGWLDDLLAFIPRRRRQIRYPIVLCLGLYVLFIYLYLQDITTLTTITGFKLKNLAFNWEVNRCSYRKDPMLFVKDSNSVLVIWEMNCVLPDMDLTWIPVSDASGSTNGEPRPTVTTIDSIDKSHVVYTATLAGIPAMNTNITYSLNPPRAMSHLFRTYTFAHLPNPPSFDNREIARFGAIADNQCEVSQFYKVLKAMTEHHKVDYLIHAGDAVQEYASLDNWQTDFASPLSHFMIGQTTPLIYAHGNHDYDPSGLYHYTGRRTWHAYTVAGVRFIVLDSNLESIQQDRWLEEELKSEESRKAWFRVIVVHISPYVQYWEKDAWVNKGESKWGAFVRTKEQVEDYPVWREGKLKIRHHYVLMKITGDRRLIWEAYDAECGSRLDAFVLHSRTIE
ncbi:hypothetical protein BG000_011047 [Podila horticola]|nr:hypothetical protein BG000_011047 [Podila horticola]